jgi:hypothetical protein
MLHRVIASMLLVVATGRSDADHFDDHQLAALRKVESATIARKAHGFTLTDLAGLPKVVQGAQQSVLVIVRTDEGNWCKLLVRAGGLKRKGSPQPRSFLHIERLTTYSADPRRGVLADKRDVYVLDGLAMDLDIGQIVSRGNGDDLGFGSDSGVAKTPAGDAMMEGAAPRLGALSGAVKAAAGVDLFIPIAPLVSPSKAASRNRTSGAVTAADFAGKFRLDVDGRFTGVLQLNADQGTLVGRFSSEQTGAVYEVRGSVSSPSHHAKLTIAFPRTDLRMDARLFTRGRTRIAGTATMEENGFGFVAERVD